MAITLRPEHEKAITQAIQSGAYHSPDEVIERALEMLRSEDQWLLQNKDAINRKIQRAIAQIDRGVNVASVVEDYPAQRLHNPQRKARF